MEKALRISLYVCTSLLLLFAILLIINMYHELQWFLPWGYWLIAAVNLITLVVFVFYSDRISKKANPVPRVERISRACTCTTKEECTYSSRENCPYEKTNCVAFSSHKRKLNYRRLLLFMILVISAIVFFCLIKKDTPVAEIIRTLCVSLFAAILIAFLIDMPGKMKEYQEYFVNLLSSNDYLNHLDDDALSKLRNRIIWVLHAKDYPNMPKSIIKLDEQLCIMLRRPFFKTFNQSVKLLKTTKNNGAFYEITKQCNVVYKVINPGRWNNPVSVDIGLSNAVLIESSILNDDEQLKQEAQRILQIKTFKAYIDDDPTPYDLLPYIRIVVMRKEDSSGYNAQIHLATTMSGETQVNYSNKDNPLSTSNMEHRSSKSEPNGATSIPADIVGSTHNIDLFLEFKKQVIIEFDYDIIVQESDHCFTKMLRYPVKYFNLNYSLGEGFNDSLLTGMLIGTLIDPPDLTTNLSKDKKTIRFVTHSWLLPKNGVFIAHYKK